MIAMPAALWFAAGLCTLCAAVILRWSWVERAARWVRTPTRHWSAVATLLLGAAACMISAQRMSVMPATATSSAASPHAVAESPSANTLVEAVAADLLKVAPVPQSGAAHVSGEVTLGGALDSKVSAGMTLFVVARSLSSPGAPVAVLRTRTGAWPISFRLDDSLAMLPDRKLSMAGQITVEARISQSGTAARAPGDFASQPATVDSRSDQAVHLVIDHILR